MSLVSHIKINARTKDELFSSVAKAMSLADYKKHVTGSSVFIKANLLSDRLVPGTCTSPWVLEGVIRVLKKDFKVIYVGDADRSTARQFEKAATVWGAREICKRNGCTLVNLSNERTVRIKAGGRIFKTIDIPEILTKVDSIVTVPVLKTHNVTVMTGALKNQWGCIPRFRHVFHLQAGDCIAELNKALGVKFAIADATVCMEQNGPLVGRPKVVNSILASSDLVALDTAACRLMGIDHKTVKALVYSELIGVGSTEYTIKGQAIKPEPFEPSLVENHPIVWLELKLRRIPVLNTIIFKTPLFSIPAAITGFYNNHVWYNMHGKKYTKKLLRAHQLYREEFAPLIGASK